MLPGDTACFFYPLPLFPHLQTYCPMSGSQLLPQAAWLFLHLNFEHNLLIWAPRNLRLARFLLLAQSEFWPYISRLPKVTVEIMRVFSYRVTPIKLLPFLLLAQPVPAWDCHTTWTLHQTSPLSLEHCIRPMSSLLHWLRCFSFPNRPGTSCAWAE